MKDAMKPLDPTKQYTLDGMPVKILGTNGNTLYAAVHDYQGYWHIVDRRLDGTAGPWASSASNPILEVPETKKLDVWVNVYRDSGAGVACHSSRSAADLGCMGNINRIACVHIVQEYKVGEGLP